MITLRELLEKNSFKNFRFATEPIGLNNRIGASGFFEWESRSDIKKTFQQGEFVVTTLSIAKDDIDLAKESLRALISNQAAAIAIKDIHFKEIPDDIKKYAEANNVPILFFSDTYIDDILFNIRIELLHESNNPQKKSKLRELITSEHMSDEEKIATISLINPYFIDSKLICAFISNNKDDDNAENTVLNNFLDGQFSIDARCNKYDSTKTIYMFIPFAKGLVLIYTTCEEKVLNVDYISTFLDNLSFNATSYRIGISKDFEGILNLDTAIKESIYANTMGVIKNENNVEFDPSLPDHILCTICYNPWMLQYYEAIYNKFDIENNVTNQVLLDTLTSYVESEGNINLTSKLTFQHSNTVRYRLSKVKKFLNVENDSIFFNQAYTFIYLNKIHKLLDSIFGKVEKGQ